MDYDDWLFESIKRYDKLSMFDVRHEVTAADWVDNTSLLLATETASRNRFEMMELLLPDKIVNTATTLHRDRDFRVTNGGFVDRKVEGLKHIPGTRKCILATSGDNSMELWLMGDDCSDLIKPVPGSVVSLCSDAAGAVKLSNCAENKLVAADTSDEIVLLDLETFSQARRIKQTGPDCDLTPLTDLILLDNGSTVLGNTVDGEVLQWDLRIPDPQSCRMCCKPSSNKSAHWTMAQSRGNIVQVSNHGDVCRFNHGCPGNVQSWKLDFPVLKNDSSRLGVQCCPSDERISISGFDGDVYIYDLSKKDKNHLEPVFIHDGHVMNSDQSEGLIVLHHLWYPGEQDVIVSMGTDGSLHAWSYRTV